ncbi:hypothetical protein FWG95_02205 [Candidatus Saccharibacteria bacterium]|nr:hypothetical protein [Candidatus Saccharibacteria bacterium]
MFNPSRLNYAALGKGIKFKRRDFTRQQLEENGFGRRNILTSSSKKIILGFLVLLSVVVILPIILKSDETVKSISNNPIDALAVLLIISSIIFYFKWVIDRLENYQYKLLRFAIDNGLKYGGSYTNKPSADRIMFSVASRSRFKSDEKVLSWSKGDYALGRFEYEAGLRHTFAINYMSVKLPRHMPQLFLNSNQNKLNIKTDTFRVKKLKLEGDFANTFTLYAPPKYAVDALQVFTPDVMAALMDHGTQYNYEILDDRLYIYSLDIFSQYALAKKETMQNLLESTARLAPEFTHQSKNYRDVGARTFGENSVADHGARIQKRVWWSRLRPWAKFWIIAYIIQLILLAALLIYLGAIGELT